MKLQEEHLSAILTFSLQHEWNLFLIIAIVYFVTVNVSDFQICFHAE